MKKFKFKLAMVLKIKLRLEELRQQELREAEYRVLLAQQDLERCHEAVLLATERYRQQLVAKLNLNSALDYQRYLTWLANHVTLAEESLQLRQQEVVAVRDTLIVATQERQMLEKLKEKAYQHYLQAELQAEHEFLDEIGTSRYVRMEK